MTPTYDPIVFAAQVWRECDRLAALARRREAYGVRAEILDLARTLGRIEPPAFAAEIILLRCRRSGVDVNHETDALAELLIAKNRAYGNAALDPIRVFSKADPAEQIRVRLDDKLSRLARGSAAGEDVELDLLGYLILLQIAEGR